MLQQEHRRRIMMQQGSSLLEVLIAFFVLGVGLLGVVALQAESLKLNEHSQTSTDALFLGNDIVERMRSNTSENYGGTSFNASDHNNPPTPCADPCAAAPRKRWDIADWGHAIYNTWPDAVASITYIAADKVYVIDITYKQVALKNESKNADVEDIHYRLTTRVTI